MISTAVCRSFSRDPGCVVKIKQQANDKDLVFFTAISKGQGLVTEGRDWLAKHHPPHSGCLLTWRLMLLFFHGGHFHVFSWIVKVTRWKSIADCQVGLTAPTTTPNPQWLHTIQVDFLLMSRSGGSQQYSPLTLCIQSLGDPKDHSCRQQAEWAGLSRKVFWSDLEICKSLLPDAISQIQCQCHPQLWERLQCVANSVSRRKRQIAGDYLAYAAIRWQGMGSSLPSTAIYKNFAQALFDIWKRLRRGSYFLKEDAENSEPARTWHGINYRSPACRAQRGKKESHAVCIQSLCILMFSGDFVSIK